MPDISVHRKLVKHYHAPGDFHELTFSCYRRQRLLTNDSWRCHLARSMDEAAELTRMQLLAFVFMPEHVHLLVHLEHEENCVKRIVAFLAAVKRRSAARIKADLVASRAALLNKLTIQERPGRKVFRLWQEGPGYDRNLNSQPAILNAIDYIHLNPCRRDLCQRAESFFWSSARWHLSDCQFVDARLPKLHRLPLGI